MFQEENSMDNEESSQPSRARQPGKAGLKFDLKQVSRRIMSRNGRWPRVLVTGLLVVCLISGVFFYEQFLNRSQTSASIYHWCIKSGAQLTGQEGIAALGDVVALTPNNVWAVGGIGTGDFRQNTAHSTPFIEHWDGTGWHMVSTASPAALFSDLQDQVKGARNETASFSNLAVLSDHNLWAVGSVRISQISQSQGNFITTGDVGHTLIEHWDGEKWQVVASPDGDMQGENSLNNIAAVSANDIWAVGSQAPARAALTQIMPLVEHWDGKNWDKVQLPIALQHGLLSSVKAIAANDVWVFGVNSAVSPMTSLAAHWDGKHWNVVALSHALQQSEFFDEVAISSQNIWAVGSTIALQGNQTPTALIAHWDGHQWSNMTGAAGVSSGNSLVGLTANGANDVWAVGNTVDNQPLIEHWDGQSWTLAPQEASSFGALMGVTSAGSKIWAVGVQYTDNTAQTLAGALIETSC
jgi:hypothetical protein